MEPHTQRSGKHGIAVYRRCCTLTSLPVQTRVAQNFDEQVCKLKNLVYSDFSLFTHVFAQHLSESDWKLHFELSSLLLRVVLRQSDRVPVKRVPDAKCQVRHDEVMLQ